MTTPGPTFYKAADGVGFTALRHMADPEDVARRDAETAEMDPDPELTIAAQDLPVPRGFLEIPRWLPGDPLPAAVARLPRVEVPDSWAYFPHLGAFLGTGRAAMYAVETRLVAGTTVAVDTETMGLAADSFVTKCVTLAWESAQGTVSVLLNPLRDPVNHGAVRQALERAGELVFQNAPFDVPPLVQNGLLRMEDVAKVTDTKVYAAMAYPDHAIGKSLEDLAARHEILPKAEVTMAKLFRANGMTKEDGYLAFDVDRPVYRQGAMADTIATLRLLNPLRAAVWSHLVQGHPFTAPRAVDSDGAIALMEQEQEVSRIMLRRSARGLQVDTEYLGQYEDKVGVAKAQAEDAVRDAGLDPDAGNLNYLLVTKIDAEGALPADWPKTDGGRLRATKDDLPLLDHPLAASVRELSETNKILGYLGKVDQMVQMTGRCHPQVAILGASSTGRMSYSLPELQQFPADARPVIVSDTGLTSVDWSQIEPVIMANCAQDLEFLAPFESGGDLYGPIQEAAGVTRKVAKVLLLATLYGQGITSMAGDLGKPDVLNRKVSQEEARRLQALMFQAMPKTKAFTDNLRQIGSDYRKIITADGRVLTVPRDPKSGQVLAYKAVNYFCQGSAYSVLSDTIIRLERAGLGDSIHLALHDELVVDTSVAEYVAEIMRTPPEFMTRWTDGRVPLFKTDSHDMGRTWLYV